MTPARLHEIKATAESACLIHHGNEYWGRILLECVLEIESLREDLDAARTPMLMEPETRGNS